MKPLNDVLQALAENLRQSVASARPQRVTVTLQCAIIDRSDQPLSFAVLTHADDYQGVAHSITLELAAPGTPVPLATSTLPASADQPASSPSPAATPPETDLLTRMFGAPGFDNAARASVFREIIEELNPDQLAALLASLRSDASEVPQTKHPDPVVATARTRVVRLLKLGPAGLAGGIAATIRVFEQFPARAVLDAIRAHWKTQSEWIDTSPPGVSFRAASRPDPPTRG